MLIVWGKKRIERSLGQVADFCPICRDLRPFELIRVGLASHVYYISFGEGKLAGHLIRCRECGVNLAVDAARYLKPERDSNVSLEVLIRDTFPKLRENCAPRLAFEARIKSARSTLSGEDYEQSLMEPFVLLNPQIEQRFANSTEMDRPAGIGCLATVLIGAGLFFGSMKFNGPTQDKILVAAFIAVLIGTAYTFVQMHFGPQRFFRTRMLPALVKALKPLKPTREDLVACVERCRAMGLKIAKVATVKEVWPPLERRIAGFDN